MGEEVGEVEGFVGGYLEERGCGGGELGDGRDGTVS